MEIGRFMPEDSNKLVVNISEKDQDEFQRSLNREIKEILPPDRNKGLYELRKVFAHWVYVNYGRQKCVQATGDSFDTLDTHYVDTSSLDDDV